LYRQPGRRAGQGAAPADRDQVPFVVGHVRRPGGGEDQAGRRTHDPPGPGPAGGQAWLTFLTERNACHLVVHVPAAAGDGAQHGLVPEQGLDPQGGPGHPVADDRLSPEGELLADGADDLVRIQAQDGDAAF
jgi:hypothetical protein